MFIEIDSGSGFCFGVVNAISSAERELKNTDILYCLGDIVHNSLEVERLEALGLRTIDHEEFARLKGEKVLLRAHGEPPSTYAVAKQNQIQIVDATCPVVLQLQKKIHRCYQETRDSHTQLVIYGKKGHAEVNGLVGQTEGTAIVIEKVEDLDKLDFNRNIALFSQTTKSLDGFRQIVAEIEKRISPEVSFQYHDTICRQVASVLLRNTTGFTSWLVRKAPTERCFSKSVGRQIPIRSSSLQLLKLPNVCRKVFCGSAFAERLPRRNG